MTIANHPQQNPLHSHSSFDPVSIAVLIVSIAAFTLILVGVFRTGASPWLLLLPAALGAWSTFTLRR